VQKLSGPVFCTHGTAEKLTVLDQTNGEPVSGQTGRNAKPEDWQSCAEFWNKIREWAMPNFQSGTQGSEYCALHYGKRDLFFMPE